MRPILASIHRNQTVFKTLGLSIVIHALIAVLLFLVAADGTQPPIPPTPLTSIVELTESPTPAAHPSEPNARPSKGSSAQRPAPHPATSRLSLSDLSPSFKPSFGSTGDVALNSAPALEDPANFQLDTKKLESDMNMRGFLEALFARVDGRLIFDSMLAQYDHFGTAYAEFKVDHRGSLIGSTLKGKCRDRILKVHAFRSLRAALANPLNENLWLSEGEVVSLRAQFQFIRGGSSLFDQKLQRIAGLTFTFRRQTNEGPTSKHLGEHLASGGIDYDPFRLYDSWSKYLKHKERRRLDTDPFSTYKNDPDYWD